jgi:hypothetical protein
MVFLQNGLRVYLLFLFPSAYQGSSSRFLAFRERLACEQLTEAMWELCQKFYKLTGSYGEDPKNDRIFIPGLKEALFAHQGFGAFWMAISERTDRNGGFNCDEMGLGKVGSLHNLFVLVAIAAL